MAETRVYDADHVDRYIAELHQQIVALKAELATLRTEAPAPATTTGNAAAERVLSRALIQAQDVADRAADGAKQEVERIVDDARQRLRDVLDQSRQEHQQIVDAAQRQSAQVVDEALKATERLKSGFSISPAAPPRMAGTDNHPEPSNGGPSGTRPLPPRGGFWSASGPPPQSSSLPPPPPTGKPVIPDCDDDDPPGRPPPPILRPRPGSQDRT